MRSLILGFLLTLLPVQAAPAEDRCTDAQKKAKSLYDQGRLEEIPGQLAPCFGPRVQREDRVAAYALLAQAFLALDDVERARTQVRNLLFFDPLYKPGFEAPPRFANLLEEVRTSLAASQTASVSKTSESLWDAPATVLVVTAQEIERRGYLDLEAVLHDLPGFDISRSNGNLYSSFYARGFRSDLNDRILFLVDGVEQNDLSSNAADLSRQYPLSNVDRIEVVYGPASTMYGANAYIGVIHVITREPEAYLGEGRRYGAELLATGGSFKTAVGELTLAGRLREGGAVWALTGRRFSSAEMDLSGFDDWDYRFDTVDYASLLRIPGERVRPVDSFFCGQDTAYYRVRCDEKGTILAVEPTELAVQIARAADERLIRDNALSFSDQTEDWSVQGKVRLDNLTAGFQAWSREEGGTPWRTEATRAGAGDGNRITPQQVSLYLRYGQWFAGNSRLQAFARYRQDRVDRETSSKVLLRTFASGERTLPELISRCTRSSEPNCFSGNLNRADLDRLSTELASEVTWMYQPRAQIETVSGFELRKSSVQLDSVYADEGNRFLISVEPSGHTGAGLYSQITWVPGSRGAQPEAPGGEAPAWSFVAGGRLDYTEISGRPARDPVFSPRLAVIHHPSRDWSLKVVYAEAFKEPTDFEKFSSVQGERRDNPDLEPERVRNLELIAGWRSGPASAEVTVYQADYRDLVTLLAFDCVIRRCPLGTSSFTQFQNAGASEVQGAQLRARWVGKTLEVLGNYTYTRSFEINPLDAEGDPVLDSRGRPVERLRVGDIAGHRANLEVFLPLPRQLRLDLRSSFIGSRQTGAGTTVTTNPLTRFAPVTIAHATLTWRAPLPSLTARLAVNNLFDRRYSDPGVRTAGAGFAASLPQPGRTFFLGLAWQSSPSS